MINEAFLPRWGDVSALQSAPAPTRRPYASAGGAAGARACGARHPLLAYTCVTTQEPMAKGIRYLMPFATLGMLWLMPGHTR